MGWNVSGEFLFSAFVPLLFLRRRCETERRVDDRDPVLLCYLGCSRTTFIKAGYYMDADCVHTFVFLWMHVWVCVCLWVWGHGLSPCWMGCHFLNCLSVTPPRSAHLTNYCVFPAKRLKWIQLHSSFTGMKSEVTDIVVIQDITASLSFWWYFTTLTDSSLSRKQMLMIKDRSY